jgi:hypothetical protein
MKPAWMDPDEPGPTALCVTDPGAQEAHRWASDVPGGPESAAVKRAHAEARSWCNRCEVRDECLEFALAGERRDDERSRDGVYGGVDPAGRAVLAGRGPKRLPPIACKTCSVTFTPGSTSARYCSERCHRRARHKAQNEWKKAKRAQSRAGRAA